MTKTPTRKAAAPATPSKIEKRTRPLTLNEALALIKRCDRLFASSARAWERANASGTPDAERARFTSKEQRTAQQGADLLAPLGISCDWPGLYPSFTVTLTEYGNAPRAISFHSTQSAVSAAMEEMERQRVRPIVAALVELERCAFGSDASGLRDAGIVARSVIAAQKGGA